jgi:eukaryotic-like serine/threonine-protein kinase
MNTVLLHGSRPRNAPRSGVTLRLAPRDASPPRDETIATCSMGLEATIAISPVEVRLEPHTPDATPARTTVLPRLETDGPVPRLVAQGKLRYEHRRRLGEGGLGEVIGARDNDIDRDVAVKRMRHETASPATIARFVEEVRTIGRLEHPNIVPIHDVGVDERGEYYFVMKYIEGDTLERVIERLAAGDPEYHARYSFERRVQIFTALLEAVAYAHAKGVVHRDIKPANVMVGAYGEVVLMDWGIAKRLRDDGAATPEAPLGPSYAAAPGKRGPLFETREGDLIGTPAYMSPEQARGESVDERSDLYSLALLFHELLCLRHPLDSKGTLPMVLLDVVGEEVPLASLVSSPHQPPVPMDLSWFVRKGLAKGRAARYQSAAEMLARLERRAEGLVPVQCHVTFMRRLTLEATRFVDRHPLLATAVLAAMVVFTLGSAIATVGRVFG